MTASPLRRLVRRAMRLTGFARWGVRPITQARFAALLAAAAAPDRACRMALEDCRSLAGRTEARELATRTSLQAAAARLLHLEAVAAAHAMLPAAGGTMHPQPALLPPGRVLSLQADGQHDLALDPEITARFGLAPSFLGAWPLDEVPACAAVDVLRIGDRVPLGLLERCLACHVDVTLPGGLAALDGAMRTAGLEFVGFVRLDQDGAGRTTGGACLYARGQDRLVSADEAVRLGLVLHACYGLQGLALDLLARADRQDGGARRHRHAAGLRA